MPQSLQDHQLLHGKNQLDNNGHCLITPQILDAQITKRQAYKTDSQPKSMQN
jgi:hypothetical protein